ncbi:MAG: sigma-70 family RNA polymerase sigma factor [Nibricoccus sp.]
MTSAELLQRYARDRDQTAFSEFVQQHFNLVYATALRHAAHDTHLARDIAQSVFLSAAQHASTLSQHPALAGWLYKSTQRQAAKHIRTQRRWQAREQKAHAMNAASTTPSPADELWLQLRPLLDDALHSLNERDREVVLLRYFEGLSFIDIGRQLGLAENSARMRVDRALEKVRLNLSRRGLTSTAAALGIVLSTHAVHAAPAGLALQTAAAISQTAAPASLISSLLLKLQLMNSLKLTALTVTFVSAASYGLVAATSTSTPVRVEEKTISTRVERTETLAPGAPSPNTRPPSQTSTAPAKPAGTRAAKPSNELLFLRSGDKILLTETVIKRFELTPKEQESIQTDIKRSWDELDALAAQNASIQIPVPGKAVITVSSFSQGADVYDRLLTAIATTLGDTRSKLFYESTASALEHNLKYCGASTRTLTVTKALSTQGESMGLEVVDTWTSAYQRSGKGNRRYQNREAFAQDYPHLSKFLPADFK